jgi:hypothetical protein
VALCCSSPSSRRSFSKAGSRAFGSPESQSGRLECVCSESLQGKDAGSAALDPGSRARNCRLVDCGVHDVEPPGDADHYGAYGVLVSFITENKRLLVVAVPRIRSEHDIFEALGQSLVRPPPILHELGIRLDAGHRVRGRGGPWRRFLGSRIPPARSRFDLELVLGNWHSGDHDRDSVDGKNWSVVRRSIHSKNGRLIGWSQK